MCVCNHAAGNFKYSHAFKYQLAAAAVEPQHAYNKNERQKVEWKRESFA